jgi:hypothetical protein
MTQEQAQATIESTFWKFAKTMLYTPHWYCLKENFKNPEEFTELAHFVRNNGIPLRYGKREYIVYNSGDYRYWVMDNNPSDAVLINRTFIDDAKRKSINFQEEIQKNIDFLRSKKANENNN